MCNASNCKAERADDRTRAAWAAELRPVGTIEAWLVDRAARSSLRVDRLADEADGVEASKTRATDADEAASLEKARVRLRREEAAAERDVHRALALLARGRKAGTWEGIATEAVVAPNPPRFEAVAAAASRPSTPCPPAERRIGNAQGDLPTALPIVHLRM